MALVELMPSAPPPQQQQEQQSYLTIPGSSAAWLQANVSLAVRRRSDCVPDGAVMLSMFGPEHLSLRRLALQRVAAQSCLMARTVSLCWGVEEGDPAHFSAAAPHRRLRRPARATQATVS